MGFPLPLYLALRRFGPAPPEIWVLSIKEGNRCMYRDHAKRDSPPSGFFVSLRPQKFFVPPDTVPIAAFDFAVALPFLHVVDVRQFHHQLTVAAALCALPNGHYEAHARVCADQTSVDHRIHACLQRIRCFTLSASVGPFACYTGLR